MSEPSQFKYRAFLSYSHKDTAVAKRLHNALETLRLDKDLVGGETAVGPVPKTLRPIFHGRSRQRSAARSRNWLCDLFGRGRIQVT